MQTSKIIIGGVYALERNGVEVPFHVTEVVTKRDVHKTETHVNGWVEDDGSREGLKGIPVSRLIDEISKRRDYIDAQAAKAAKAKAEHEARAAKQWLAVQLLAKAIGAQAVKKRYPGYKGADYVKWDQHEAAVIADGYSLEVNEEALDNIIATFGKEADNGTISDHFRPGGIYHNNETETENN